MDYEKKYKEALERAKKGECLENIFPELKESEDEKMREMAIKAVYAPEAQSCIKSWGINPDDVIAWLEKQCVQKPIISNNALREGIAHFGITQYQIDNWLKKYVDVEKQAELQYWKPSEEQLKALDYAFNCCPDTERGNYYEGVLRTLIDELYKLQEKQGEQKPADKVETKQKSDIEKDKWYVCNTAQYTDFVVGKAYYCPKNGMLKPNENEMARYVARNCFRPWTIQDAKDGDVLYDNYTNTVLIFKSQTCGWIKVYCNFWITKNKFTGINFANYGRVSEMDLKPATKEQRDMLFQKMKEVGYEWDFEVKKLNKIE